MRRSGFLFLAALFVCVSTRAADVRLTNPGFEMGDRTGGEWHGEGWDVTNSPELVKSGGFAVANTIEPGVTNEWRVFIQAIPSAPGQSYTAHLWMTATNAPGVEYYLELQFLDDNWNVVGQHQSDHLKGNMPFTLLTIAKAVAPDRTAMVGIRGAVYVPPVPLPATGYVAMDDFDLLEMP